MKPTHTLICILTLVSIVLTGCGSNTLTATPRPSATPGPATETTVEAKEAVDEPTATEVSVVDALNRTITFDHPPQRIVVAGKSALTVADAAFTFSEAQERVVALGRARQNVGEFLQYIDPTFEQKTLLEVQAGPEQIAAARPDVVLLKSYMANSLGPSLGELGIPVVYLDLETPEQYFDDLETLGQLFSNPDRAQHIQSFYRQRLDRVSLALQDLETSKPRVLLLQHSSQGGEVAFNVPAAAWIQTIAVEMAGGVPVWTEASLGSGWTVVNLEQIAAWNPDKLFVVDYDSDPAQVVTELAADPQWEQLQAVQSREIYGFPKDIFSWDQPDPRWILGFTWLAKHMHPDAFSDLNMMAEIYSFFGQIYRMDEEAIEQHIIPALEGDVR